MLPNCVPFSDRIELTLLAPPEGVFDQVACIAARPDRHARARRRLAIVIQGVHWNLSCCI